MFKHITQKTHPVGTRFLVTGPFFHKEYKVLEWSGDRVKIHLSPYGPTAWLNSLYIYPHGESLKDV